MHYWNVCSDAGGVAERACWCWRNGGSVWRDAGSPGEQWMPLLLGAWRLQGLRGLWVPLGSLQVEDVGQTASASRGVRPNPKGNAAGDSSGCVFPLLWVSVAFGLAAALLCCQTCHHIKHCLLSESQQLKICTSNPPHWTNSHLLQPPPPKNTFTLHMANSPFPVYICFLEQSSNLRHHYLLVKNIFRQKFPTSSN